MKPDNLIKIYKAEGNLPCTKSAIQQLVSTGQLQGGSVINDELTHIVPLFPQGAPVWYSQFSSDAQGLLNAAEKGEMSVGDALNQLAQKSASYPKP
jgi:multiple sugar transport system substrate-binding protein